MTRARQPEPTRFADTASDYLAIRQGINNYYQGVGQ
jgi:hypothetical protein